MSITVQKSSLCGRQPLQWTWTQGRPPKTGTQATEAAGDPERHFQRNAPGRVRRPAGSEQLNGECSSWPRPHGGGTAWVDPWGACIEEVSLLGCRFDDATKICSSKSAIFSWAALMLQCCFIFAQGDVNCLKASGNYARTCECVASKARGQSGRH